GRHIVVWRRSEDDIPLEPGVRRRPVQSEYVPGVGLNNVIGEDQSSRSQSICSSGHDDASIVVDQSVERNPHPVWPIMTCQWGSIGDLPVAVADLYAGIA